MTSSGTLLTRFALVLLCLGASRVVRAEDDVRFSATLTPEQRTGAGLDALSVDNVAVIDGLIRQDLAASKFRNNGVDHTRFSQRRTAHERDIAGLEHLAANQLVQLDELVRKRIAGPDAAYDAVPTTASTSTGQTASAVRAAKGPRPLEIHGSLSYTYGWSKNGSFQGGDMVLTYDDPARRFSILVGYSEYHGKGLPYCYYPGGGPFRAYTDGPLLP